MNQILASFIALSGALGCGNLQKKEEPQPSGSDSPEVESVNQSNPSTYETPSSAGNTSNTENLSILSINRGTTPNPVELATLQETVDYEVTFSHSVVGLSAANFTLFEVGSTKGATGTITSIQCYASPVCKVKVKPQNPGNLRLDLTSFEGVSDLLGNPLASTRNGDQIYELKGWYQEAYIKPSNSRLNIRFGTSVSLSGDTLTVGVPSEFTNSTIIVNGPIAPNSSVAPAPSAGAAYIYRRTGSTWEQEAYIKAANAETNDQFGTSVSLSGDTLAVGAPLESENSTVIVNGPTAPNSNGAPAAGAVYVYRRTGSTWEQEAYIKAANAEANDFFGNSVSLSGDTLAVGASDKDDNSAVIVNGTTAPNGNGGTDSGAAYIYRRTGSNWAQEAYIKPTNAATGHFFGSSVSLSGETLAVGSEYESGNSTVIVNGSTAPVGNGATQSGAVYIFQRTGSTWSSEAYIKAVNAEASDWFGGAVSLSGDTLTVGAHHESGNSSSIVNGTTAPNGNGATHSGAVYVYLRIGSTWAPEAYIKAANASQSDYFGKAISLSGSTLTVGAAEEDENTTQIVNGTSATNANGLEDSGAVYIYRKP